MEKLKPVQLFMKKRNPPTSKGEAKPGGLYQEAMDVAIIWISIGETLFYNMLAFYTVSLVREYFNSSEIEPEAENGNFPVLQDSTVSQEQNVRFINTHPGYSQVVESTFDALRDDAFAGDASLQEFFSRPIRVATYSWVVGADLFQDFDPWTLYFQNLRVINRLSNYRLLRCKLHVRFTINGNGFYYGRALASYNPFPNDDTLTIIRQFVNADLVAATQRPHIFLDPTNSQGGDLVLPFFTYENVIDIVGQTWQNMGTINIKSMQNLKHANGAVTPITVNVFVWAEDVRFAIPTQFEPGSIAPQSDEYAQGPVSRVAGAVAKYARMLVTAPTIGPFARATELGAMFVGAVATLFGYSKPQILDVMMVHPKAKANLATSNAPEDSTKLSLDIKQELSIDPRTAGLGSDDELTINYIASRESYLTTFQWNIGTVQEALLFNAIVDPCLYNKTGTEYHFPACCYATMPFKFWRGSMKFRFQIVCSNFHKGRLKVVYDPVGTPPIGLTPPTQPSAEYNTAYTTIIDIADNTDFTIDVGWGQNTTYREHFPFPLVGALPFASSVLGYASTVVPYGNGTVAVYVVNDLTTPNSVVNNDIAVNVFISMGYGFEVAAPTTDYIGSMRYHDILPESQEMAEEVQKPDSPPTQPDTLDTAALVIDSNDAANLVYFGERISSMRQLLKRYNLVEVFTPADEGAAPIGTNMVFTLDRYNLPMIGGVYPAATLLSSVVEFTLIGPYVYGYNNMLHYVSLAYGGWKGGVRYFIDACPTEWNSGLVVDRLQSSEYPRNLLDVNNDLNLIANKGLLYERLRDATGIAGASVQSTNVNPTLSFEVPYYSRYRFVPAKRLTVFDEPGSPGPDPFQGSWKFQLKGKALREGGAMYVYACGAEDFTAFMFLGAPRIYFEAAFPVV
nr:MAG: polyprotein 2 [Picornavirales sp.]